MDFSGLSQEDVDGSDDRDSILSRGLAHELSGVVMVGSCSPCRLREPSLDSSCSSSNEIHGPLPLQPLHPPPTWKLGLGGVRVLYAGMPKRS